MTDDLEDIALMLVADGKRALAANETFPRSGSGMDPCRHRISCNE